ncbi:retrovirus-related pol polyprotein from transposon TNT 1-94 [Tanacetum coccineum]
MLSGSVFLKQYWTEAVATTCYTQNRSTIVKRHLKTPYEIFRKRILNINFLHVFGCLVYIYNHKDQLGKFDEKADDGYLLRYLLVFKAFRVFNTRRQQTKETYHITFDESPDAIKFSRPSVDIINIAETERYPSDEYLHPYETSQRYQTNNNDVSFIEPYECPELVVLETKFSSDQNGQADQNDQSAQTNEILNDDMSEHSNHTNDEPIIDNIPNTKYIQIPEHFSSPDKEDTSVQNTIPIPNPSSSIPSMVTPSPQDRWSQDKHIELVNIIHNPGAGMLTRAMAKELSTASTHECLFVVFLSKEEPKKVSEALKHPGWLCQLKSAVDLYSVHSYAPYLAYPIETLYRGSCPTVLGAGTTFIQSMKPADMYQCTFSGIQSILRLSVSAEDRGTYNTLLPPSLIVAPRIDILVLEHSGERDSYRAREVIQPVRTWLGSEAHCRAIEARVLQYKKTDARRHERQRQAAD